MCHQWRTWRPLCWQPSIEEACSRRDVPSVRYRYMWYKERLGCVPPFFANTTDEDECGGAEAGAEAGRMNNLAWMSLPDTPMGKNCPRPCAVLKASTTGLNQNPAAGHQMAFVQLVPEVRLLRLELAYTAVSCMAEIGGGGDVMIIRQLNPFQSRVQNDCLKIEFKSLTHECRGHKIKIRQLTLSWPLLV